MAVWRFKPILSAVLRFHSHLSGGLRLGIIVRWREIINLARGFMFLRVFVAVIQTEFKRLRRLSGNFTLLKVPISSKLLFSHPILYSMQ